MLDFMVCCSSDRSLVFSVPRFLALSSSRPLGYLPGSVPIVISEARMHVYLHYYSKFHFRHVQHRTRWRSSAASPEDHSLLIDARPTATAG
jgi:hypothetical protein